MDIFKKVFHILFGGLVWCFGNGHKILLSGEKLYGMASIQFMSARLLHCFNIRGILYLVQLIDHWEHNAHVFKMVVQLRLSGPDAEEWAIFQEGLQSAGYPIVGRETI